MGCSYSLVASIGLPAHAKTSGPTPGPTGPRRVFTTLVTHTMSTRDVCPTTTTDVTTTYYLDLSSPAGSPPDWSTTPAAGGLTFALEYFGSTTGRNRIQFTDVSGTVTSFSWVCAGGFSVSGSKTVPAVAATATTWGHNSFNILEGINPQIQVPSFELIRPI